MPNWISRTAARWRAAEKRRRDAMLLASLPDYLLHDIGISRDGLPSLARRLRPDGER